MEYQSNLHLNKKDDILNQTLNAKLKLNCAKNSPKNYHNLLVISRAHDKKISQRNY